MSRGALRYLWRVVTGKPTRGPDLLRFETVYTFPDSGLRVGFRYRFDWRTGEWRPD